MVPYWKFAQIKFVRLVKIFYYFIKYNIKFLFFHINLLFDIYIIELH